MNQILMRNELYRKLAHLLLILIPIAYYYLGKWQSLTIFAIAAAIIVPLDYWRRRNEVVRNIFGKVFGIILRHHESDGQRLCGASWVAIATCVNFLLFQEAIAVTAFTILVISDAAAAIIGRSFSSQPFFEKSLYGSIAFAVSGFVVLVTCGIIFDVKFWFYIFGVFALFVSTLLEARPSLLKLDDNFVIPISFSLIMTIFDIMWSYSY